MQDLLVRSSVGAARAVEKIRMVERMVEGCILDRVVFWDVVVKWLSS